MAAESAAEGGSQKLLVTGVIGMLAALALFRLGNEGSLLWVRQLSFIGMLWSLIFAIWGRGTAKLALFPVWYLTFTISAPSLLEELVLKLQSISSTAVFYVINGLGFEMYRSGCALYSVAEGSEFQFEIAGSCSGIRSLLALTAFTALYAWYSQKSVTRKWLLFMCSVPVAVLCNIIRVFSICLVAVLFGQEAAIGYYHDYSGYVIALVALLCIFRCGGWINTAFSRVNEYGRCTEWKQR